MALVRQVILYDHLIKGSRSFIGGNRLCYFTILPSLFTIGIAVVQI